VKIVVQVKLLPASAYDADALAATLRASSDGQIMAGRRLNRYRKRQRDLRTRLPSAAVATRRQ
jgi:hypothetical protein